MYWLAGGRGAVLCGGHQAEAEEDDEDSELHHGQSGLQSQSQPAGICNLSAAPWLAVLQYCTWLSLVKVFMSTMQMSSAAVYLTPLKKRNATTSDVYQTFLIFDFLHAEELEDFQLSGTFWLLFTLPFYECLKLIWCKCWKSPEFEFFSFFQLFEKGQRGKFSILLLSEWRCFWSIVFIVNWFTLFLNECRLYGWQHRLQG